jgi:acetyltransferase EpsM
MSGVIINTGTLIGNHCIINTSSSIDHDNIFKNFSSCGPGVTTGGNVTVGDNSYIGIGSVIKHSIKVGSNIVVGGNAFVNKDCSNNYIYYGVPIKKIRKRKINENYL